jgi:SAM-dependent methyltransferase
VITVDFKKFYLRPGDRVLDIGCGSGRHTAAVVARQNVIAVGADRDASQLPQAKERLNLHDSMGLSAGGRWSLLNTDICRLPFASESFDRVICSEVLEHVPDDTRAIQEVVRVLKPGKTMAVSVPRFYPERICWALSPDYAREDGGHVRIYRKRDLFRLLQSAGIRILAHHHAHSLHTPYWWLKCLIGLRREDIPAVNQYHRFLTWDIMQKPALTRYTDRLLNPLLGKSLVIYGRKL